MKKKVQVYFRPSTHGYVFNAKTLRCKDAKEKKVMLHLQRRPLSFQAEDLARGLYRFDQRIDLFMRVVEREAGSGCGGQVE